MTPYELEVALEEEPSWLARYILEFDHLLTLNAGKINGTESKDNTSTDALEQGHTPGEDSEEPTFSLITGTYRHVKRYPNLRNSNHDVVSARVTSSDSTLVLRNQSTTVTGLATDSAAAQFLQGRTYRGLEPRLEEDNPSILEQGRTGIARGYQADFDHSTATA